MVAASIFSSEMVFINDPLSISEIFGKSDIYSCRIDTPLLRKVFTLDDYDQQTHGCPLTGFVFGTGERHKRLRNIGVMSLNHPARKQRLERLVSEKASKLRDRWVEAAGDTHEVGPMDLTREMHRYVIDVAGELLFSHDFRQLVRGAPHLQVLDLSWCDALRDESIIHLTAGECNSSLTSLSLRCLEISDAAVRHFCHFSQLRCLVLSRCDSITDFGLEALCKGCTQLVTLDLSWLTDLSSHALLTFLPWLTKIETLSLEGLKPVADEHLLLFAACLTHLRTLTLTWCNGMCTFLIPLQFWP